MKKMLTWCLALVIFVLIPCAVSMAEAEPNAAVQENAAPTQNTTASVLGTPTAEQEEEMLAVYQRFVDLCQARGETISDTAFAFDPDQPAGFGVMYLPVKGVEFTGVSVASLYYLNIDDIESIPWERHCAFWADMVRAIEPQISAERATQLIDTLWGELRESHPGTGTWDGHFEERGWGFTVIRSPEDVYGSMFMAGPNIESADGEFPVQGPVVMHLEPPQPEDLRAKERRVKFCSLVDALGMSARPDEEPVDTEIGELYYSCYKVTDALEWTDLSTLKERKLAAHYVLYPSQDTTKESVSDLTRSVLQAAVMAAGELDEEAATTLVDQLIDALEEDAPNNRLISTINIDDRRIAQLRAGAEDWFILISVAE